MVYFMIKKIIIVLIIALTSLLITGCATTEYKFEISSSGEIREILTVALDEDALLSSGFNLNDSIIFIKEEVELHLQQIINNFYNEDNGLSASQKTNITNGIGEIEIENNIISLIINFANIEDYRLFYNIDKNSVNGNDIEMEDYMLISKITTQSYTKYKDMNNEQIYDNITNHFNSSEETNNFSNDDLLFYYYFLTQDKRVRSDSEKTIKMGDFISHKWEIPYNDFSKKIKFYQYRINVFYWYSFAAISTLIFLLFIFLCDIMIKQYKGINKKDLLEEDGETNE